MFEMGWDADQGKLTYKVLKHKLAQYVGQDVNIGDEFSLTARDMQQVLGVLRHAVKTRAISINALQHELVRLGYPCSVSSVSNWISGAHMPQRTFWPALHCISKRVQQQLEREQEELEKLEKPKKLE